MRILYNKTYEREGNDAWLIDEITITITSLGLVMYHIKNWNGWGGPIKESNVINLDMDDVDGSQKRIDDYIDNNSLYSEYPSGHTEGIKINLKNLLMDD